MWRLVAQWKMRAGTKWEEDGTLAMTNMQCGTTQDRCADGGFGLWSLLQGNNTARGHPSRTLLTS